MRNLNYLLITIFLLIGVITAIGFFNESVSNKIVAEAKAESMIIRASAQSRQDTAVAMFPYFVLALGFLGLLFALSVWIVLSESRNKILLERNSILSQKPVVERHYIESQKIVLIGRPQDRKEFYRQLDCKSTNY